MQLGSVYIVRARLSGLVKIGYSARIANRLSMVAWQAKERLELLGKVPGTFQNETSVHHLLRAHSARKGTRSWYRPVPAVKNLIAYILSPGFRWEFFLRPKGRDVMAAEICRKNLKILVQEYKRATGRSLSQISKRFYGNVHFLHLFFAGKQSISIDKFDEMLEGITKEWPKNARWPFLQAIVIPRPPSRKKIIPNIDQK